MIKNTRLFCVLSGNLQLPETFLSLRVYLRPRADPAVRSPYHISPSTPSWGSTAARDRLAERGTQQASGPRRQAAREAPACCHLKPRLNKEPLKPEGLGDPSDRRQAFLPRHQLSSTPYCVLVGSPPAGCSPPLWHLPWWEKRVSREDANTAFFFPGP